MPEVKFFKIKVKKLSGGNFIGMKIDFGVDDLKLTL